MMGATPASPSWSYYLVDLTTMAPQPELLYLLYNSTYLLFLTPLSLACVQVSLIS
jgi:hypothetical protein